MGAGVGWGQSLCKGLEAATAGSSLLTDPLSSANPPRPPCLLGWGVPVLWTAQARHSLPSLLSCCHGPPLPPHPAQGTPKTQPKPFRKGAVYSLPREAALLGLAPVGAQAVSGLGDVKGAEAPSRPRQWGLPSRLGPAWPCCSLSCPLVCPPGITQRLRPRAAGRTECVATAGQQDTLAQGCGHARVSRCYYYSQHRDSCPRTAVSADLPGTAAVRGSSPSATITARRKTLTIRFPFRSLLGKRSPGVGPGNATSGHKPQGRSLQSRKHCSRRPGPGCRWAGDEPRRAERRDQVGGWCPASRPPRSRGEGCRRQAPGPEDSVSPAFAAAVTHQDRRPQPPVLGSAGDTSTAAPVKPRARVHTGMVLGLGRAWGFQSLGGGSLGDNV